MKVTATQLRQDIYGILDRVLKTGVPVEITRRGRVLRIVPDHTPSKLDRLKRRPGLIGDPESIVHLDWLKEWSELK